MKPKPLFIFVSKLDRSRFLKQCNIGLWNDQGLDRVDKLFTCLIDTCKHHNGSLCPFCTPCLFREDQA